MSIAYLDCFSGISGNMFLGALLDAGLPLEVLREQLKLLELRGYDLVVEQQKRGAIEALHLTVSCATGQAHRSWRTIRNLIETSGLAAPVKQKAGRIFRLLAEAEAKVHGLAVDEVHFHEVGAVDSIIDIVGVAIGLQHLGITQLITSPLPMPRGWVQCEHGKLPLPAPAVCEILRNVPVQGTNIDQELVTPTGAALVKAMSREFGPFPPMVIKKVGYGAGTRELANQQPNLVRLIMGEAQKTEEAQRVEVIETHLDDWSPEGFPHLCEKLLALQALDVSLGPLQMKKGRPGFLLRVIADPGHAFALKQCIFSETTAIGLRFRKEQRWTLPRESGGVDTAWGKVLVKKVETPTGPVLAPEYEDCRRVAAQNNIALKEVYAAVARLSVADFTAGKNHG